MGGLSFLSPLYLLGILAIAVPVALHLFRRRTDHVVEFPAVRLLTQSPVEQQRRKRLRELILLALRVTALTLLAFAFARPYLSGRILAADAAMTVVALDRSFSLSSPGVFDRARSLALQAVADAPAGNAVALLAFDEVADLVVAPTTDRGQVGAAIRGLVPGVAGTQYGAMIARAADVLGPREGEVVVVTDLQQTGWQGPPRGGLPEDVPVRITRVESPLRNLAVVSAERRGARVEAVVRNFGLDRRDTVATLAVGGAEVARASVTVEPQALASLVFDADLPAEGGAAVAVADEGGVPTDDTRYLVLDPPAAINVLVLVAGATSLGGGLYVERALEAVERGRAFTVTVLDGRSLSSWTPEQVSRQHALMILGTRTMERRGRELTRSFLADGGAALIALGPDIDVATLGEILDASTGVDPEPRSLGSGGATLVLEDTRHPILRPFATPAAALGDVTFERYRAVGGSARRVLARFSGGAPALLEEPRPRGRLLLFTSDLDNAWNRFPLSPAFVPFVVEAGRYLSETHRQAQTWVLPNVPPGVAPRPGVHSLTEGVDGTGHRVAVNVNLDESNPAPMSETEFLGAVPRTARTAEPDVAAEARQAEGEQRLWQWGLLLMFVALAGEGLIGRRAT